MNLPFCDAYTLPNHWRLTRVENGFALFAPTADNRFEPGGLLRHHIGSFLSAFAARPTEEHEFSVDYNASYSALDLDAAFKNLPVCYGFCLGWKLLKAEQHFKLAPPNCLFSLPAAIISHCVPQFARDLGGQPLLQQEAVVNAGIPRSMRRLALEHAI